MQGAKKSKSGKGEVISSIMHGRDGGIHEWAVSLIHQIYFSGFAVDCTKWTMNGADTSEPPDDHHA